MVMQNNITAELLKQYIARIQSLEEDKGKITEEIKETYLEAKDQGLEPKILKQLIREMNMRDRERSEHEQLSELLETYRRILGLA